jgi:isoamylase
MTPGSRSSLTWSTTTPPKGTNSGQPCSSRALNSASDYRLLPNQKRYYINDTGTGNAVSLSHPRVIQMLTDSLCYWTGETHVEGFRFDLGTSLAREPHGLDEQSGFLKACGQHPRLQFVKLMAEPWDFGGGGYQVGGFPPGWSEWNDKFRDNVHDFWKRDASAAAIVPRLCASGDIFDQDGRRPFASVNFITARDGFRLNDIVTYNEKHYEANGEDRRDGSSDNRSWNCGVRGRPTTRRSTNCAAARSAIY